MSAVEIACVCPGTPHERDTINLRDVMDFVHGKALRYRVQLLEDAERADSALVLATLTEGYLLYGIESWTLVDDDGKPLPVNAETIRSALLVQARGRRGVRPGRRAVRRGGDAPFAEAGTDLIAAYADRRIDVSDDWLGTATPAALEAILDLHYPDGRHRGDFGIARWRLQVIAEMEVGQRVREAALMEDAQVARLRRMRG